MRTLKLWTAQKVAETFGTEIARHALGPCGIALAVGEKSMLIVGLPDEMEIGQPPSPIKTQAAVFPVDRKFIKRRRGDKFCGVDTFIKMADSGYLPPDDRIETIFDQLRAARGDLVALVVPAPDLSSAAAAENQQLKKSLRRILRKLGLDSTADPSVDVRFEQRRFVLTIRLVGEIDNQEAVTTPSNEHFTTDDALN